MRESPFNCLPPELRLEIWECAFAGLWDTTVIRIFPIRVGSELAVPHPRLNLLLTCKRISQEARPLVWRNLSGTIGNVQDLKGERALTEHNRKLTAEEHLAASREADNNVRNILQQLGARISTITQLECQPTCAAPSEKCAAYSDEVLSRTAITLLPKLTGLRVVSLHDFQLYYPLTCALATEHENQGIATMMPPKAREHPRGLRRLLPEIEQLVLQNTWRFSDGCATPITLDIEGSRYTHLESGKVWEMDMEAVTAEG